ncbi:MAG: hypothetical protein A2508_04260 [Candidatus Lambdaproteobacteria bacterium RIFOXYD12_FULL_49_8]|uniref:GP-PDE domain-containing protein n=1 Tax=Candidatus Lambdaproteobacteria bacterium RIFOXYD2_FULL_50_16 TaxID=1817772 RepID=A0A1F6G9E2_9PROT|nr:MAG: hypothetical protein A2527_05850 [Candidatus Lambdaproteobacteria bacterium RIFOXYD2_FULL_50_16]OGG98121.1 MAG: hypothetical protein A2508_04260 [Candidatus Lambdaproteobacteria bacterium RIFOXYD12_FULL_49_8]
MPLLDLKSPFLVAHRGFSAQFPENTLASFTAAQEAGAVMLEMDLALSQDRQIVILHDETLERTTNGQGPVKGLAWKELGKLDAGSWFGPQFKGVRLPNLEEVLDQFGGQILLNLEIKTEAFEPNHPQGIVSQLAQTLAKHGLASEVLVSSFCAPALFELSQIPGAPNLALLSESPLDQAQLDWLKRIQAWAWNPDATLVTKAEVNQVKALGYKVITYTANRPKEQARLFKMGIDGIFTDGPVFR